MVWCQVRASGKLRNVIVLLGVRIPEDEIVMLKPARDTKDLFGDLSNDERSEAITFARGKAHNVRSPLFSTGNHKAQFVEGRWQLDGRFHAIFDCHLM